MTKITTPALVLFTLLAACVTPIVDVFSRFRIQGVVVNEDGHPVQEVEVYFLDISLDQWASEEGQNILVGRTDREGYISEMLPYTWGYIARNNRSTSMDFDDRRFRIILKKDGFNTSVIDFKISEMPTYNWETVVELGTVNISDT